MLSGFLTDGRGSLQLSSTWPDVPADTRVWVQAWLPDGSAPAGWSASNGLRGTAR